MANNFVCLFVGIVSSHSRIFHSYGDVTTTGERFQILTYARHLWPLSSEVFLACHTYCDTGHPFIVVITEDLRHSHLLPSVGQWNCHYLYLPLRLVEAGIVCCTFSYVLYSSGVEQSVIPKSKMARDKYEYASIIRILKDNLTYLYFLLNIFRTNKHNNNKHFAR